MMTFQPTWMRTGLALAICAALASPVIGDPGEGPGNEPLPDDIPTQPPTTLAIGADAPDFALPGVDDETYTLASFEDAEVLMVVFNCNHCPDAQLAEASLKQIVDDYADRSFAMVVISSNNPLAIRPDELSYSVHGDSFEDMKRHAEDNAFNFPYLYDGATQEVGRAYGGLSSPHCFVFDSDRKLRYTGRINNLHRASDELTDTPARDAIEAVFAGEEVAMPVTRAFGCTIKWLFKIEQVAADEEAWQNKPVTIEPIDGEAVASLAANDTEKLRVINVWSTTCGPCIAEMPALVLVNRNYQNRPFELITISTDPTDESDASLDILQDCHAALGRTAQRTIGDEGRTTNNYIWDGGDLDALAEALDAEWAGPLPYTVVIAPGGEVLYRHTGEADIFALRHVIVNYLGRYWP